MSIYTVPDWFEWGELAPHRDQIQWEIFSLGVYDQYRSVKTHDVVVDIGASVGPFSYIAGIKNPKKILVRGYRPNQHNDEPTHHVGRV